jgi:hypothetical protein
LHFSYWFHEIPWALTPNRQVIVILRSELILTAEQIVLDGFSIAAVIGKGTRDLRIEFSPLRDRYTD